MTLPIKSWDAYAHDIKALGENHKGLKIQDEFLKDLGFIDEHAELTETGRKIFNSLWIARDESKEKTLMHNALMMNPETLAICQALYGVVSATKANALSVLRNQKLENKQLDRRLGTLLSILKKFGVIGHANGSIRILESPFVGASIPPSVFISPSTPFSNQLWLSKILRSCTGFIYWLDKHFLPLGLEVLLETAEGTAISEIRILSLDLETNSNASAKKKYLALQTELLGRDITVEWRFIDSKLMRRAHDRWIIGSAIAWNVPDIGTISSGNYSELSQSDHHDQLKKVFEDLWEQGIPF